MSTPIQRSPHLTGGAPTGPEARNAALLIDFDNITLGVRSDLGKELKTLLNAQIFRGKVAVRRAYADWRRYPNYVVPLTEASIDLIFAPAYGTSKKNATDLRMAVDAIELAFMRPEIGTYILLTGDSDFSSCVIKLKEYGKYVIGVGMRDSSSDLLIQNCDEYYSYHALSGLMREGEQSARREDPWLLVRKAVAKMASAGDSMRTDRLKQVMIDLDPGFDEKDEGYSKFSKFVQVASEKGLIRLHRVENGQYEVAPVDEEDEFAPSASIPHAPPRRDRDDDPRRDRDRERRRDRRDRDRDRNRDRPRGELDRPRLEETPPVRLVESEREPEPAEVAAFAPAAREEELPVERPAAEAPAEVTDPVGNAYGLLQYAVRAMVSRSGQTVRDGDVKRKMMELQPGFDEHALGFSKFTRFLRQAHDAEVIDLRRLGEGRYEVALPSSGTKLPAPVLRNQPRPEPIDLDREQAEQRPAAESSAPAESAERDGDRGGRDRGRGRGRDRGRGREGAPPILPGQGVERPADAPRAEEPRPEPRAAEPRPEQPRTEQRPAAERRPEEPRTEDRSAPPSSASREGPAEAARSGMRHRTGGRGGRWAAPSGPPPLLPGQVVHIPGVTRRPEPAAPASEAETPVETTREPAAEAQAPAAAPQPAAFSAESLGLPTTSAEIEAYLSTYKGVGKKTVESLVNAFGDGVFRTLEEDPDAVRSLLTDRRAAPILEQWSEDRDRRREERASAAPEPAVEAAPDAEAFAEAAAAPSPEPVMGETADDVDAPNAGGESAGGEPAEEDGQERGGRGRRGRGRGRGRMRGDAPGAEDEMARAAAQMMGGDSDRSPVESSLGSAEAESVTPDVAPEVAAHPDTLTSIPDEGDEAEAFDAAHEDSDPTLTGDAALAAGEAQRRKRGRRGGRGRGRGRAGGEGTAEAAPAPEARPEPTPAPAPAPVEAPAPAPTADAGSAAEGEAARRSRSRRGGRGRSKGGNGNGAGEASAAPVAEAPAPTPAPTPAPEAAPAADGDRPRGRGRGRGGAKSAAPEPPMPTPEAPAPSGGRGRGRGGAAKAAAPAPTPAPAAEEPRAAGRGRGRGRGAGAAETPAPEPTPAPAAEGGEGGGRPRGRRGRGNTPPATT